MHDDMRARDITCIINNELKKEIIFITNPKSFMKQNFPVQLGIKLDRKISQQK